MPKLILKAVSSSKSAASAAVDQVVGQVDTASGAQRLTVLSAPVGASLTELTLVVKVTESAVA